MSYTEPEEKQDVLGLEKILEESAKISDPQKEFIKDLFNHYTRNLTDFLEARRELDQEEILARVRVLNSIVSWIKLEKRDLLSLIKTKKQKNLKTTREQKFLEVVENFLKKVKADKNKYGFH